MYDTWSDLLRFEFDQFALSSECCDTGCLLFVLTTGEKTCHLWTSVVN